MDELRFRSQQSPRNESTMNTLVSPPRNGNRLPQPVPTHDPRTSLPRRFTTDSGRVPTLSTITTQRGPDPASDYQTLHKVQLIERKKKEYERLRQQRERFELEMQKIDQAQRREQEDLVALQEDLGRMGLSGHQSEPTTPPEYRETSSGFPTMLSRPNRYSTSSLTSPPGLFTRPSRSGSQIASPQAGILGARFAFDDQLPSRSVPGSRRNSDEDEKEEAVRQDPTSHRSTNALNRYSMPVTRSRTGLYDTTLDQTNTTRFLFGDEDQASQEAKYMPGNGTTDDFPTLVRLEDQMLSASSAALDLALAPSPAPETSSTNGWGGVNRHRSQGSVSQLNGSGAVQPPPADVAAIGVRSSAIRHSLDMKYFAEANPDAAATLSSAANNHVMASPPKLQTSYSANDVPTVKNTLGMTTNANNHAQQHFHNHNASLGRIPAGAMPNRHSRELSNDNAATTYPSIHSALQGSAAPFGPSTPAQAPHPTTSSAASPQTSATAPSPMSYGGGFYGSNYSSPTMTASTGAFGVPLLALGMQNPGMNGGAMYPQQNYTGYGALFAPGGAQQPRDSQARVIQHRRQLDNEAMSRYQNLPLEAVGGQIYELCKDQHGCRYLQKQLEDRDPAHIRMIWVETNQHVIELMTDPFGNYLCQKLLEYCNDSERTALIRNASQDMVRIALNQHGTRALQKMIEFITTPEQVQIIIDALRFRVVDLIQDLNGNHVIQKCLNKLAAADAQFIFDAVGNHCVEVGTHRHGCCVLQRCIDHASGDQKVWLIQKITENAPILVQDPFGNYVVQYIIDLNITEFTEPLVERFQGRICSLSRHKFSSNVIEKCLRCAENGSKDLIVDELLAPGEIERLIRDSFANYVIQTALEYATPAFKHRLVESIRPILPQIRQTPYGRRIAAKVQAYEQRGSANNSGQVTPSDVTGGQIPLRPGHARTLSNNGSMIPAGPAFTNGFGGQGLAMGIRGNGAVYPSSSNITVPPPAPTGVPQPPRGPPFAAFPAQPRPAGTQANNAPTAHTDAGETHWF